MCTVVEFAQGRGDAAGWSLEYCVLAAQSYVQGTVVLPLHKRMFRGCEVLDTGYAWLISYFTANTVCTHIEPLGVCRSLGQRRETVLVFSGAAVTVLACPLWVCRGSMLNVTACEHAGPARTCAFPSPKYVTRAHQGGSYPGSHHGYESCRMQPVVSDAQPLISAVWPVETQGSRWQDASNQRARRRLMKTDPVGIVVSASGEVGQDSIIDAFFDAAAAAVARSRMGGAAMTDAPRPSWVRFMDAKDAETSNCHQGAMMPLGGHILCMRKGDDTLYDKNGNAAVGRWAVGLLGCWLLAVGCDGWYCGSGSWARPCGLL